MNELDVDGVFWASEDPDHKMAGHLRFNPTDGATLSLIEPLRLNSTGATQVPLMELLEGEPDDGAGIRLLGITGSHVLTLDRCRVFASALQANGHIVQRRYRISAILMGAHLGTEERMNFSSVSVQLGNLANWVGRSGLSVDTVPDEDSESFAGIRLTYEPVSSIETNTDDGSIAVLFPWWCQPDPFGNSTVEHKCALEYRFREPQPLARILQVCSSLRNLVTICVRAPSAILNTKLTHSGVDRPIDFSTKWIGAASTNEVDVIDRSKMSFTFDDIGGVEGIRAWLNLAPRYSVVIALLVSHWYVPPLFQEQRYFNAVVAAETLIRIRKKKPRINLKEELHDLARELDSLFVHLVGDLLGWAGEVVRTRVNYVVHPGLQENSDGYRLYLLSESIYGLVVLTLLQECGVSIDSLKNIRNHQHFKWLAAELGASV